MKTNKINGYSSKIIACEWIEQFTGRQNGIALLILFSQDIIS